MRLTDDAMLVFARMMNEECQERSCPDCTFFIEQERKCLFDSRPVVWDALPDTPGKRNSLGRSYSRECECNVTVTNIEEEKK